MPCDDPILFNNACMKHPFTSFPGYPLRPARCFYVVMISMSISHFPLSLYELGVPNFLIRNDSALVASCRSFNYDCHLRKCC